MVCLRVESLSKARFSTVLLTLHQLLGMQLGDWHLKKMATKMALADSDNSSKERNKGTEIRDSTPIKSMLYVME